MVVTLEHCENMGPESRRAEAIPKEVKVVFIGIMTSHTFGIKVGDEAKQVRRDW